MRTIKHKFWEYADDEGTQRAICGVTRSWQQRSDGTGPVLVAFDSVTCKKCVRMLRLELKKPKAPSVCDSDKKGSGT